jgi:hypothetical protein
VFLLLLGSAALKGFLAWKAFAIPRTARAEAALTGENV